MNVGDANADGEVLVDINTTPLIDVMLVLLTLLVITLPIQTHAVKLDMPRPNQPPHPSVPQSPGRLRRGSDFRDQDLHEPPVEDPDDAIPD